jgi:hypothetical protein
MRKHRRLWDTYRFPGFRPRSTVRGIFGDPKARIVFLDRRGKKRFAQPAAISSEDGTIASGAGCGIWRAEIIASTWSDRFHGTYPPNYNEGHHLITGKGTTLFQLVPKDFCG